LGAPTCDREEAATDRTGSEFVLVTDFTSSKIYMGQGYKPVTTLAGYRVVVSALGTDESPAVGFCLRYVNRLTL